MISRRGPKRKHHGPLTLDESKVCIDKERWCPWACIDLTRKEVLAVRLTTTRSYMDTLTFPSKLVRSCRNRCLVQVERGSRYPRALRRHHFGTNDGP